MVSLGYYTNLSDQPTQYHLLPFLSLSERFTPALRSLYLFQARLALLSLRMARKVSFGYLRYDS